ncbi:MAG TPA: exosortase-associated EpsI family protein [Candidatus Paceibacterota bacterium]|nr:exosortase-associated EpsI family protein [Verrucomicrobiota bacterium]HRZ47003.1 exosortase-associated EpsI family protein [Candidatus Paceibacterota bacterium]HRZ92873.1 exosortase-associated EpsI family protein [Candidatus Paceibacterota bacterium]
MRMRAGLAAWVALAIMGVTAGVLLWYQTHQRLGNPGIRLDLPERVLGYESQVLEITEEERGPLPADTTLGRRLYQRVDGGRTNQILLDYVLMGKDRTSLHKPQFCLVGQGWTIDQTEERFIAMQEPHPYDLPVMRLLASKPPLRCVFAYWFVAEDGLTAHHWQRMWWMARNLFRHGVLQRWAYVRCIVTCLPGQEETAYAEMERFIAAAAPRFMLVAGRPRPAAGVPTSSAPGASR